MGFFGFKLVRQPRKIEDSDLEKRIVELELKIGKLESHIISLRGFVNRKLDLPEEGENLKEAPRIDDGLDSLRP